MTRSSLYDDGRIVLDNVTGMLGCFDRLGEPCSRPVGDHTVIDVPMSFEAGRLAFDHVGQTAGLSIVRPEALA